MRFPLHGSRVLIKGIKDDITSCKAISSGKLKGLLRRKAITHCVELRHIQESSADHSVLEISSADIVEISPSGVHEPIQKLVHQFDTLFQEPTELPPLRQDDHHIPLMPRAQPENIRPYRYSPQ